MGIPPQTVRLLVIMNLIIWGGAALSFPILLRYNKLKASGKYEQHQILKNLKKFSMYKNNVFFRRKFKEIYTNILTMSCYDLDKAKSESVKIFENALFVSCSIPIIFGLLMRDISMFLSCIIVGYIYYNISISKRMAKVSKKITEQTAISTQSTRDNYMEVENIPKALQMAEKGSMLERPIAQVIEILTSKDGDKMLDAFCAVSPIRLIKTLATTCHIINELGDERDEKGNSAFAQDLIILRQEADAEVRRLEDIRVAFKSLSMISLLGLITMPIVEAYLLNQIPGTSTLLRGNYGLVCKIIIIGLTTLAYYSISVMMQPSVVNQSDRIKWIDNLCLDKSKVDKIKPLIPKETIKLDKIKKRIDGALSQIDLVYLYMSKVCYSSIAFIGAIVILTVFMITSKSYLYNNYNALDFSASTGYSERVYSQVVKMDRDYLSKEEPLTRVEDRRSYVKSKIQGLNDMEIDQQAARIDKKYRLYHAATYKWFYLLFPLGMAWASWFLPEVFLIVRKKMVEFDQQEDIMQLLTMCIVLSSTNMDVYRALYWLEKQASIHKEIIRYCYREYPSDPIRALDNMKRKSSNPEFRKVCNKLSKAAYTLSLEMAFSDVILDKEQYMNQRERLHKEVLESKKQNAKLICGAPFMATLILMAVLPILILGITQLLASFNNIGNL